MTLEFINHLTEAKGGMLNGCTKNYFYVSIVGNTTTHKTEIYATLERLMTMSGITLLNEPEI